MKRMIRRLRRSFKRASHALIGALAIGLLKGMRLTDPDKLADFAGWAMRTIGPLLPENRIGRANLVAAFPGKSKAEIDTILRGCWDNLGRMGAEFAHLDRLWVYDREHPTNSRIELAQPDIERFHRLLDDGKPALIFAAHLANWELPAICAATYKLDSAVLYRRPNIAGIDRWLTETRIGQHGRVDLNRPLRADEDHRSARARRSCWHAGRSVLRARRSGGFLRPAHDGKSAAGSARAPFRLSDPWHPYCALAGSSVSRRTN